MVGLELPLDHVWPIATAIPHHQTVYNKKDIYFREESMSDCLSERNLRPHINQCEDE